MLNAPKLDGTPCSGQVIGDKYRLDEVLGSGAMGVVWSATHLGLGTRVAVKLISPPHLTSADIRRRFDAEARAAARLRSRFIVSVFDNGVTEGGIPYLVMEQLEGETLESRIARGPLGIGEVVRIVAQVGRGLTRAHAEPVVHRDLKPANVFLTLTEDGDYAVKVLDFGVAKILRAEGDVSGTSTGTVLGTPLFMSPEQAQGLPEIDHRTDLYALGMVAFNALTGSPAITGTSLTAILLQVCSEPLPSLAKHASWLPPALDAWFQKACARNPDDRYQSATELVDALIAASGVSAARTVIGLDSQGGVEPVPVGQVSGQHAVALQSTVLASALAGSLAERPLLAAPAVPAGSDDDLPQIATRSMRPFWVALAGVLALVTGVVTVALRGGSEPEVEATPASVSETSRTSSSAADPRPAPSAPAAPALASAPTLNAPSTPLPSKAVEPAAEPHEGALAAPARKAPPRHAKPAEHRPERAAPSSAKAPSPAQPEQTTEDHDDIDLGF